MWLAPDDREHLLRTPGPGGQSYPFGYANGDLSHAVVTSCRALAIAAQRPHLPLSALGSADERSAVELDLAVLVGVNGGSHGGKQSQLIRLKAPPQELVLTRDSFEAESVLSGD